MGQFAELRTIAEIFAQDEDAWLRWSREFYTPFCAKEKLATAERGWGSLSPKQADVVVNSMLARIGMRRDNPLLQPLRVFAPPHWVP